jgi:hypothetical protein
VLPRKPSQLNRVSVTVSMSCMSKIRPRQPGSSSQRAINADAAMRQLLMSPWPVERAIGRSGVRLVGEPLPGCLPGDSQGNRDLVP